MKSKFSAMLLPVIAGFLSCTHKSEESLFGAPHCYADTAMVISFRKDIAPLFRQSCAVSGCHSGTAPQAGLDLDSAAAYGSLSRPGSGYLNTVNPKGSLLYSQMISITTPMPPTGRLDSCNTKLILNWITQGAKNN